MVEATHAIISYTTRGRDAFALPDVERSPIARMRDQVAHHYWATDREIVWATATVAVPELCDALTAALERLT